jgi:preprotein translocase subunit SecF
VIRGFVFAMLFGVVIGTYSTLYVAKNIVLMLGVDRGDKPKKKATARIRQRRRLIRCG